MRKVHVVLTIGGGFLGAVSAVRIVLESQKQSLGLYAMGVAVVALYLYGLRVGLRLVDGLEERKSLRIFYALQVPWISSPLVVYHFTCGFQITGVILDSHLRGFLSPGSYFNFGLARDVSWGAGLNGFALAMLFTLRRPNQSPEPTALIVTPPAAQEPRQ